MTLCDPRTASLTSPHGSERQRRSNHAPRQVYVPYRTVQMTVDFDVGDALDTVRNLQMSLCMVAPPAIAG